MRLTALFTLVCFFLTAVPVLSHAQATVLLVCDGSGCKYPKTDRQKKKSSHIGFLVKDGQELLKNRKVNKLTREKVELYKGKIQLKEDIIIWERIKLKQANKAIIAQQKSHMVLKKENDRLIKDNREVHLKAAQYKGDRYLFLVIGLGVGVVLTGGLIIGVVLYK